MGDLQLLQGCWARISVESDGKMVLDNPELPDCARLELICNQYTLRKGDRVVTHADFYINPHRSPKHFDVILTTQERRVVVLGLYRLQRDRLTLSLGQVDVRPDGFTTPPGLPRIVAVFKRMR